MLYDVLVASEDAVSASNALRAAPIKSCLDLGEALSALASRDGKQPFRSQETRALIEESLQAARASCAAKQALQHLSALPAKGSSQQEVLHVARSLVCADPREALEQLQEAPASALVRRRRAQLLSELGQSDRALSELIDSLADEDDEQERAHAARLALIAGQAALALSLAEGSPSLLVRREKSAALAALGRDEQVIAELVACPLDQRAELALYVVQHALHWQALASAPGAPPELLLALAREKTGELDDKGAALLESASQRSPEDADILLELAAVQEAIGRRSDAILSLDRAALLAPQNEHAQLAPIRLLVESNEPRLALQRCLERARQGRKKGSAEELRMASLACKYAQSMALASALANEALLARPGDGRLHSELAMRLQEEGQIEQAAQSLAELLVCGAHGHPWHRHEISARLAALVDANTMQALVAALPCPHVDDEDLQQYLAAPHQAEP